MEPTKARKGAWKLAVLGVAIGALEVWRLSRNSTVTIPQSDVGTPQENSLSPQERPKEQRVNDLPPLSWRRDVVGLITILLTIGVGLYSFLNLNGHHYPSLLETLLLWAGLSISAATYILGPWASLDKYQRMLRLACCCFVPTLVGLVSEPVFIKHGLLGYLPFVAVGFFTIIMVIDVALILLDPNEK